MNELTGICTFRQGEDEEGEKRNAQSESISGMSIFSVTRAQTILHSSQTYLQINVTANDFERLVNHRRHLNVLKSYFKLRFLAGDSEKWKSPVAASNDLIAIFFKSWCETAPSKFTVLAEEVKGSFTFSHPAMSTCVFVLEDTSQA